MNPLLKRFLIPFSSSFVTFLLCTFVLQNQQAIKEFLFYPAETQVYHLPSLTLTLKHSSLWEKHDNSTQEGISLVKKEGTNDRVITILVQPQQNSIDLLNLISTKVKLHPHISLAVVQPLTAVAINQNSAQLGKVKFTITSQPGMIIFEQIYTAAVIDYGDVQVICLVWSETEESLDILYSIQISPP